MAVVGRCRAVGGGGGGSGVGVSAVTVGGGAVRRGAQYCRGLRVGLSCRMAAGRGRTAVLAVAALLGSLQVRGTTARRHSEPPPPPPRSADLDSSAFTRTWLRVGREAKGAPQASDDDR